MNYLDNIILDNTLGSYLLVIGIIFFIRIFRKYLSMPLAAMLYHSWGRLGKLIEKKQFIELIGRPLGQVMTVLIGLTAISNLRYPEVWNFEVFNLPFHFILNKTALLIVIIALTRFTIKLVSFIALIMERKKGGCAQEKEDQLIVFSRDLLKVSVGIAGILMILRFVFERDLGSLLTGLSIVGAALALAAKETIENLIASFIIFFDKPFTAGDMVRTNNIIGYIEHIGLRSTRIRTMEKTLVSVPNKQMVDSQVDNWSNRTERRAEIRLEILVQTPTPKIHSLTEGLRKLMAERSDCRRPTVFFSEFSKTGKTIVIEYFTEPVPMDTFSAIKEKIITDISFLMESLEIQMATGGANITVISDQQNSENKSAAII